MNILKFKHRNPWKDIQGVPDICPTLYINLPKEGFQWMMSEENSWLDWLKISNLRYFDAGKSRSLRTEKELPVMHPLTSWRDDGSFIDFFFCFTVIIIWRTLQIYYRFLWKSSSLLWRETFLREIIWFDVIVWFLFQTFRIRLFSQGWTNRVYIGSANYELEHTTGPK